MDGGSVGNAGAFFRPGDIIGETLREPYRAQGPAPMVFNSEAGQVGGPPAIFMQGVCHRKSMTWK